MDPMQVIKGVVLTKVCSIKPGEDSTESKKITLKMSYDGLTLNDIFIKALKNDVISWANGSGGRKNYDNLKDGQIVKVSAKSPGSLAVDPQTAVVNELATMDSDNEREDYVADLLEQASKLKAQST